MSGKILYLTDRFKVSAGYEPAFTRLLNKNGIRRQDVITTDIYNIVEGNPLKRKGNEVTWKFDPAKKDQIERAFLQRVAVIKPTLIVVSCPAVLGFLSGWDSRTATVDKMRGGVYWHDNVPVVVVLPITAIHQRLDQRIITNDDGEEDKQTPYRVPQGEWILKQDWSKVGRFHAGKQRLLPRFQYSVVRSLRDCEAARRFLSECVLISEDIETGCWPAQITCVGYTGLHKSGAVRTYVFPLYDEFAEGGVYWASPEDHEKVLRIIAEINALPILKTFHNGNYDNSYFIRDRLPTKSWLLDSMYMWHAMYPELPKTLDFVSSILIDSYQYWKDDIKGQKEEGRVKDMEQYWRYCGLDAYYTLFDTLYLVRLLLAKDKEGKYTAGALSLQRNYNDNFMRALSGLAMSMRGVKVDFRRMAYHRRNLERERDEALDTFRYMIDDPDFNINSPQQKCSLLYDVLGVRERNARGRFVASGKGRDGRSAGQFALKLAKADHPFFRLIIEAMEAAMVPDTQLGNVFGRSQPDGTVKGGIKFFTDRFRTAYNPVGTETWRFSSKGSNFWDGGNQQNLRDKYRDFVVADEGCVFLDIDYSQSDDVFMAYESQDLEKIRVVESGLDGHAVNAEFLLKRDYDWIVAGKKANDPEVTHPITGVRQITKKLVHAGNFQMAGLTAYVTAGREAILKAAQLLGHPDAEQWEQARFAHLCDQLIAAYRKKYPRLSAKEYYGEIAKMLRDSGIITNCFGLSRRFLGSPADSGTQREATAYIGQSATASNMNRVMYEIDHGFIPESFRDGPNPHRRERPLKMNLDSHGLRFMMQVHDNFVSQLTLTHPRWREAAHNILQVMNRPVIIHGREVSVRAEASLAFRWGKDVVDWDGKDPYDLDRIVMQAQKKENSYGQ